MFLTLACKRCKLGVAGCMFLTEASKRCTLESASVVVVR